VFIFLSILLIWVHFVFDCFDCWGKKLSWSKSLVRKWFNIKSKAEDFHADNTVGRGTDLNCHFTLFFSFFY
jgi:hypothetical protein